MGNNDLQPSAHKSIEFIPAVCPSCGGELRVPKGMETIKCMYCGIDIIFHQDSYPQQQTKEKIQNILTLAKFAEEGRNFEEAYKHYSQLLEYDPTIIEAWIGKGYSAGMQSEFNDYRFKEATTYINKGLSLGNAYAILNKNDALHISEVALYYAILMIEFANILLSDIESEKRSVGIGGLWLNSKMKEPMSACSSDFTQLHTPLIINLFNQSWRIQPDLDIAKQVYEFIGISQECFFISKDDTEEIASLTQELQQQIQDNFPNWQPPKSRNKERSWLRYL